MTSLSGSNLLTLEPCSIRLPPRWHYARDGLTSKANRCYAYMIVQDCFMSSAPLRRNALAARSLLCPILTSRTAAEE